MSILLLSCNNIHIQPGGPVSSTSLALWWPLLNKDSPSTKKKSEPLPSEGGLGGWGIEIYIFLYIYHFIGFVLLFVI